MQGAYKFWGDSVFALSGDDVTDSAAGALDITFAAGNEVDVAVENRLPRIDAVIHADIETTDIGIAREEFGIQCGRRYTFLAAV